MGMVGPKIPFQKWYICQISTKSLYKDDRFVDDLIEPEVKTVDCSI